MVRSDAAGCGGCWALSAPIRRWQRAFLPTHVLVRGAGNAGVEGEPERRRALEQGEAEALDLVALVRRHIVGPAGAPEVGGAEPPSLTTLASALDARPTRRWDLG